MKAERRVIQFKWQDENIEEPIEGNLQMGAISPVETREALNRAVGKYAYYGALLADAKKLREQIEFQWDVWYGEQYMKVCDEEPKGTETYKSTKVMLANQKEWESRKKKLREVDSIIGKIDALRSAFKLQANTLQTIGSMLRSELEMANRGGSMPAEFFDEEEDENVDKEKGRK